MDKRVWLSYDLPVPGDYKGLYSCLDDWAAKECGSNVATFLLDQNCDIFETVQSTLAERVNLGDRSRIYLITKGENGKYIGKFLFGHRQGTPWAGYGRVNSKLEDDEDS